jgi:hypothetical protein
VVRPPVDEDDEPAPFPDAELPEDDPPDDEPPDDDPPDEEPPEDDPPPPPFPPPPPPPFRFHNSSDGEKSVVGFRVSKVARTSRLCDCASAGCGKALVVALSASNNSGMSTFMFVVEVLKFDVSELM